MVVGTVGLEESGKLAAATFDLPGGDAWEAGGWGARPRVELVDEEAGEVILLHQTQRLREVLCRLRGEPANDVCCYSDARNPAIYKLMLTYMYIDMGNFHVLSLESVDNVFEFGEAVFSLHVLEHAVRATLHWHVEEGVDSGVCQDLPNFLRCEGVRVCVVQSQC